MAAAWLGERLYVFGITDTKKPPLSSVVVVNSTQDGVTWTGWEPVEGGARPEGMAQTDQPLDVAASQFDGRLYIASRWQPAGTGAAYTAVNFSSDGPNWSGWRQPETTTSYQPGAAPRSPESGTTCMSSPRTQKPPRPHRCQFTKPAPSAHHAPLLPSTSQGWWPCPARSPSTKTASSAPATHRRRLARCSRTCGTALPQRGCGRRGDQAHLLPHRRGAPVAGPGGPR